MSFRQKCSRLLGCGGGCRHNDVSQALLDQVNDCPTQGNCQMSVTTCQRWQCKFRYLVRQQPQLLDISCSQLFVGNEHLNKRSGTQNTQGSPPHLLLLVRSSSFCRSFALDAENHAELLRTVQKKRSPLTSCIAIAKRPFLGKSLIISSIIASKYLKSHVHPLVCGFYCELR